MESPTTVEQSSSDHATRSLRDRRSPPAEDDATLEINGGNVRRLFFRLPNMIQHFERAFSEAGIEDSLELWTFLTCFETLDEVQNIGVDDKVAETKLRQWFQQYIPEDMQKEPWGLEELLINLCRDLQHHPLSGARQSLTPPVLNFAAALEHRILGVLFGTPERLSSALAHATARRADAFKRPQSLSEATKILVSCISDELRTPDLDPLERRTLDKAKVCSTAIFKAAETLVTPVRVKENILGGTPTTSNPVRRNQPARVAAKLDPRKVPKVGKPLGKTCEEVRILTLEEEGQFLTKGYVNLAEIYDPEAAAQEEIDERARREQAERRRLRQGRKAAATVKRAAKTYRWMGIRFG